MKNLLSAFIILISLSSSLNAKTIYVTDNTKFTLRRGESIRSKILKMLPSGSELTLIKENPKTGYSKVRTDSGVEGYILNRHILSTPTSRWHLDKVNKELQLLQQEFKLTKRELNHLRGNNTEAVSSNESLIQERNKLNKDLTEIRQTAANAIKLKHDRDESRKKIITLSNKLREVTHENQILKDSANQDWFLYGGVLSLFSVLLGFILPKLSWRSRAGTWDTF